MRSPLRLRFAVLCITGALCASATQAAAACGEVITLATHGSSKTSYSLAMPTGTASGAPIALVLLPGGGGFADLGSDGCARKLVGNSLVRSRELFHGLGFATALVDAPSDHLAEPARRVIRR